MATLGINTWCTYGTESHKQGPITYRDWEEEKKSAKQKERQWPEKKEENQQGVDSEKLRQTSVCRVVEWMFLGS